MPESCEDGREGTSWWSWHPRFGRAAPALPKAAASLCTVRLSAQLQARVRGAWRHHDVQQLQEALALPVCMGRDPGQRRLTVQNQALICGKDRSGSSSLPSSWLCWGNGGPEQPRHQPKVTEARCCCKRKPQRPPRRPELPGNAASVGSTGFSLLPQSSCLRWASGERRGLGATLLGGGEESQSAVGLRQVFLWGEQWRDGHSPPTQASDCSHRKWSPGADLASQRLPVKVQAPLFPHACRK